MNDSKTPYIVHNKFLQRLLMFFAVSGPGLIVMIADNDAGAIGVYTAAGAIHGVHLIWLMLLLLPVTYFVQEMVARLGIVTGQGYMTIIYKRFGEKWGFFSFINLQIVNFLTLVTEFALIAMVSKPLGVSPFVTIPMAVVGLIIMVSTANYRRWERITMFLCLFDLAWIYLMWRAAPSFGLIKTALTPDMPACGITTSLVFLVIAIVGTTIAPWQLFFQQSCVADKKLRFSHLKYARLDTFIGACVVILVAAGMMIVGNMSLSNHITYHDPAQMAVALGKIFGIGLQRVMLLLMMNAAILGIIAISLASAWAYGEVKGYPHSLQLSVKEAPKFYGAYILLVCLAAGIVLIPHAPLQLIILSVQVLAGIMLPPAIVFLQLLLNDKALMGDKYINRPWNNLVNWIIVIILFALSLLLAVQVLLPNLF